MGEIYRSLYSVIPARVRDDHTLRPNAKLLYGELSALAQAEGYCWAWNARLAETLGSQSVRWRICFGSCGTVATSAWRWSVTRTARKCCAGKSGFAALRGFPYPLPVILRGGSP